MSTADAARAVWPRLAGRDGAERPDAETGGRPPRPRTGPVLMGDIHGAPMGTPMLLLLWKRWEDEARDDG